MSAYPYRKIEISYVEQKLRENEQQLREKLKESNSEDESFSRLDKIPLSHIEKYLRKRKLEKIKK